MVVAAAERVVHRVPNLNLALVNASQNIFPMSSLKPFTTWTILIGTYLEEVLIKLFGDARDFLDLCLLLGAAVDKIGRDGDGKLGLQAVPVKTFNRNLEPKTISTSTRDDKFNKYRVKTSQYSFSNFIKILMTH